MKYSLRLAIIVSLLFLVGCDGDNLFDSAPGNYQGSLLVSSQAAPAGQEARVNAKVTRVGKRELSIEVNYALAVSVEVNEATSALQKWAGRIRAAGKDKIAVSFAAIGAQAPEVTLKRRDKVCFGRGDQGAEPWLCFDGRELQIQAPVDVHDASARALLVVGRDRSSEEPKQEDPASYSVEDLVRRAIDQSYESRVAFENVVAARVNLELAQKALYPHISFNTSVGVATLTSASGLVRFIGDLVPFLIPARWYYATEVKQRTEAEAWSTAVVRLDAAATVEGMGLAIERDTKVLAVLASGREYIRNIRNEILDREQNGPPYQIGDSDQISAILSQLDTSIENLDYGLKGQYRYLAAATGFHNPRAIAGLTRQESLAVPGAEPAIKASGAEVASFAMPLTPELRQLDAMLAAAETNNDGRRYAWLDPAAPNDASVGLNLKWFVVSGLEQARFLLLQREKAMDVLTQKVQEALDELEHARRLYSFTIDAQNIYKRQIDQMVEKLESGKAVSLPALVNALQGEVSSETAQLNAVYSYNAAIAKLGRLLVAGKYRKALEFEGLSVARWIDSDKWIQGNVSPLLK